MLSSGSKPSFTLSAVQGAASAGRVLLGGPSYKQKLLPCLETFGRMIDFTQAVLLELNEKDFMGCRSYESGGASFDTYGCAISRGLQARFGIEGLETWYVKFTLDTEDDTTVVMASLHGAEQPLDRVGGTLSVRFTREIS